MSVYDATLSFRRTPIIRSDVARTKAAERLSQMRSWQRIQTTNFALSLSVFFMKFFYARLQLSNKEVFVIYLGL